MTAPKTKPLTEKQANTLSERAACYQFLNNLNQTVAAQAAEVTTKIRIAEALLEEWGIPLDTEVPPAPEPVPEPLTRQQRREAEREQTRLAKRQRSELGVAASRVGAAKKKTAKKRVAKKAGATKAAAKLAAAPSGDGVS